MQIIDGFFASLSQQVVVAFWVAIVLSVFFFFCGKHIEKADPLAKPSKLIVVLDMYFNTMSNLFNSVFRGKVQELIPYVSMLIVYILAMNYIGLIVPVEAPATDYNVPLGLVIITVVLIHSTNIRYNGLKNYISEFFQPFKLFVLMNVIEIFTRPFSMSMRMFCNLLSGAMILGIVYEACAYGQSLLFSFGPVDEKGLPLINIFGGLIGVALKGVFEIFFGGIQAFIFTILTIIFVGLTVDTDEDKKEEVEVAEVANVS